MRIFGTVKTFNRLTGTGYVSPEQGGKVLPFRQMDVARASNEQIEESQRLSYEVETDDIGELQAVNLEFA